MDEVRSVDDTPVSPTRRKKARVCPYCKRSFRRHEHLQRHLRIHTNEKPYQCDCGATFSRRDLLKRHQSIGHAPNTPSSQPFSSLPAVYEPTNVQSNKDETYLGVRPPLLESTESLITQVGSAGRDGQVEEERLEANLLFNPQDLSVFQDLDMFNNNLGLNDDWYFPSEPSLVRIFPGDFASNNMPTTSIANPPNGPPSGAEQILSKLPTDREAVAEFGVLTFPILVVTNHHRERTLPVPSPLSNYILLHAIIQRILLAYHTLGPYNDVNNTVLNGQKEVMRNSLYAWTSLWQQAPESSLDPRNPNGPVTYTSTALLGVAYIRLGLDLGSYRILQSRDAREIANRLLQIPRLPPGPHLLPAILHATHALSIPVKLGVNYVARSHAFVWSVQHSLCGLEFAIFLSKWLFCIADNQTRRPLDEHEARLVNWISDIVEEGRTSADEDLWSRPSDLSDCSYLGFAVVKLWARLIKGNGQWSLFEVVGDGLDLYANTCEQNLINSQTAMSESR
ncbi:transcriptional regulator family: C2H2 zinc finger [Aspergillus niger]|nr:transcriptional regulator family: C2H2 zinc finger [Aspergillus niger]KAI2831829.1 transcriptional regulator family: C2H2 zinc finger [Aspergillus niger]KAI2851826.1 transcriptional regulator family: C2H2 zinc finger [Aspergillus niger]KAI2856247.1 transcriptional regulator family: C2H2 zinc finger [Aspergillus niger]KAI2879159.1 transcriptional regulator family: C2H2 zinc finger [Aspergillus niger]